MAQFSVYPKIPTFSIADLLSTTNLSAQDATATALLNSISTVAFNVSGTWVGTLTCEASIDGVTFFSLLMNPINGTAVPTFTTTTNGVFNVSSGGYKSIRLRMSAYTSGTAVVAVNVSQSLQHLEVYQTLAASLKTEAWNRDGAGNALTSTSGGGHTSLDSILRDSSGVEKGINSNPISVAGTVASGAADSGNPVKVGGVYNSSLPTYTSGNRGDAQLTVNGRLMISAIQEGIWDLRNITGTVSLPTGASTSAKQDTGNTSLASIDTKLPSNLTVTSTRLLVDGSGVTQPVSAVALPLPTGAATETTLAAQSAKLPATLGQKAMAASLSIAISSDQSAIPVTQSGTWTVQPGNTANTTAWLVRNAGKAVANAPVRNDYSSVNVTTSAYVQLVASTTSLTSEIEIFDSSGQVLALAVGAAASEVNQLYILPGGNGRVPLAIPAGSRVSVKAITASATSGQLVINFYGI